MPFHLLLILGMEALLLVYETYGPRQRRARSKSRPRWGMAPSPFTPLKAKNLAGEKESWWQNRRERGQRRPNPEQAIGFSYDARRHELFAEAGKNVFTGCPTKIGTWRKRRYQRVGSRKKTILARNHHPHML
jgi:hypothetical protein